MSHLLTVHWGNAELRLLSGWDPKPFLFLNRSSRSEFLEQVLCSLQRQHECGPVQRLTLALWPLRAAAAEPGAVRHRMLGN